MATISVIMSVYNTSSRLVVALDSLLEQTFSDFELILINDGSTDDSASIIDEYAEIHPQIRVFHRNNYGISASRNFGVRHATGTYIYFMDSDDKLDKTMLADMLQSMEENDLDAVRVNFRNVYRNGKRQVNQYFFNLEDVVMSGMNYFCLDVKIQKWNMKNMTWMWLFKRERLTESGVLFPEEVKVLEDVAFMAEILNHCERVGTIFKPLYEYIQYEHSLTNTMKLERTVQDAQMVSTILADLAMEQEKTDYKITLHVYGWMLQVLSLKIYRLKGFGQKELCHAVRMGGKQLPLAHYLSFWQRMLLMIHPVLLTTHLWVLEYAHRIGDKLKKFFKIYNE